MEVTAHLTYDALGVVVDTHEVDVLERKASVEFAGFPIMVSRHQHWMMRMHQRTRKGKVNGALRLHRFITSIG